MLIMNKWDDPLLYLVFENRINSVRLSFVVLVI